MRETKKEEAPGKEPPRSRDKASNRRFLMLEQRACRGFAKGLIRLTQTEFRVWMALMGHANMGNTVTHNQAYLAEFCGIAQQNFNSALKGLVEKDMVATYKPLGKQLSMMLSPEFIWMGAEESRGQGAAIYKNYRKVMDRDKR